MASRTKQKEEARARRLAEEAARAQRARRERRLRMIGGAVLGAVVVVVVAISISSGGGTAAGLKTGKQATQTTTAVRQLLSGIPQSGTHLGNPRARVTMTYYGDLECPACQAFTLQGGFPQLVASEVRAGKVQVLYRAFETATRDPTTFQTQQVAALAAGEQQHFWDFTELFYHEQGAEGTGYATESYFDGLAKQIPGLNYSRWLSARNSSALAGQLQADMQSATVIGVGHTPTLIMHGPRGKLQVQSGVPSYTELEQAIKSVA